jgi:hypothetical protein
VPVHPQHPRAAVRLVVMLTCAGVAACTYNFDRFAGAGTSSSGGASGARAQTGGSGAGFTASGGAAGATAIAGGAAGTVATGGTAGTVATGGAAGSAATGGQTSAGSGGAASGGRSGTDAGVDGSAGSCAGPARDGICWYIGPSGSSCQQVCASHGQPSPGMATHVGTASQGGSLFECEILLGLLGVSDAPASGSRSDGLGLGCHLYSAAPWWLSSPNFSTAASHASAKLVCGCTQ